WREASYRGGFRGRGEGWGRGAYGSEFYGRRPSGGRGFVGGGPGRAGGAFPGERGWGGAPGYPGASRYRGPSGYGAAPGFIGGRRRGGLGPTGRWGYGGEYRSTRGRPHEYGQDFGDRLEHGWSELKRGVRGMFGGHDYDREYRRRG
ncbi:MAG TPA: hypothetical protein VFQ38_23585, partial [Longimicrobiales bacterium]|nr:hypothetical protein [Longimicrobiales bacterium]